MDGHIVEVAEWLGDYGEYSHASGGIVNEGPLAGLLNEVHRWVEIEIGQNDSSEGIAFVEHQLVDRVLSPSVVSEEENTPPSLVSVGFREGRLLTEGDSAHLEALVYDFDTDVTVVTIDLSELGLGTVELSDSGLQGDHTIHDDIWTALITYDGLNHGMMDASVVIEDFWVAVEEQTSIEIINAAPRMISLDFMPDTVRRGETVDVSVTALDGHGIDSVGIDLLSAGGALSALSESDGVWSGNFVVPDGISPGERSIPVRITDGDGETVMAVHTHFDGFPVDAPMLTIENEAPSVTSVSLLRSGETAEKIHVPHSGDPIPHSLEASIDDPDGISSVQAKIGRLAPIGSSGAWLLMVDDGTGGDRVSGDGIYTLQFDARASLPEGNITIQIRATDTYLSTTPTLEQPHILKLEKLGAGGGSNWFSDNSTTLVFVTVGLLLIVGIAVFAISLRKSDTEW
jgi:hypothetical protein